ncbi:MAG: hypothetical protein A3F83_10305 [Candidatus Glassbacteria bacterium RIFCSPLOWO2_12_FULL_58_11]|uniref:Isoprenylcysteine carboxylmethyltransferase family protein n=1 Tax=Candidatus Glassbacteria bacterium RIFCSPLOWO2_12_FULL_58_11 TaxID=1817867 RepID=A0A1F5YYE5_9BACT|nr:MAG: hypothetical protein A3F83_10305 [Candidatus Glassbacteria bacterium RIFCSPLOWO2_12_FULL_58_11]
MRKGYIALMLKLASKERSAAFKTVALLEDGFLYLAVVPGLLIWLTGLVIRKFDFSSPLLLDRCLSAFGLGLGLFFLVWATWAQLKLGRGTPHVAAPPVRLIVRGPYRLCRHPIQLGIMNYYLGLGAAFGDAAVGLIVYALTFIGGSLYHRFVEEEELHRRFGRAYERYRRVTPFLIPRIRRAFRLRKKA